MASDKITPEEIVEGGDYTLTFTARAGGQPPVVSAGRYFRTTEGDQSYLTLAHLAAATITRHQREPQVGDVGTLTHYVGEWPVIGVVTRSGGAKNLVLWREGSGAVACSLDAFTLTRPVSS